MGLKKQIVLKNGVITNYHRIVSINKITNQNTLIEIASYTSEQKREEEKECYKNNKEMNVFINTTYMSKEYNETDTIEDCYKYLKGTENFKDSENC